jgi:uncharacterized protein with HEPN domain
MIERQLRPRLNDVLRCIDLLDQMVSGKTIDHLAGDPILRLAIERAIEIISEAARHIPENVRAEFPDVPWRSIFSVGNVLRHEYDRLDTEVIWDIAVKHARALRPAILAIKKRLETDNRS